MNITINDEKKEIPENTSFFQLISSLGLDSRKIAIERNLTLVPRTKYEQTLVNEGDSIEIISFIGGG